MRKIDELLQLFNGVENKIQTRWDWMESECFDEIPNEIFYGLKQVACGLNEDSHRWYDVSTTVYEVAPNEYLCVRHISDSKSESQEAEDCCVTIKFFEMEEVQVISYKQK